MKALAILPAALAAFVGIALGAGYTAPVIPRPAKEFSIIEVGGKQTLLSEVRGNVVVFQFLQTTCPHCQNTARMLNKVAKELGPKGLKVFGVAFTEEVGQQPAMVTNFIKQYGGFPVGIAPRVTILKYLGIPDDPNFRWVVPQIMIIDRKGQVRAQSNATGAGSENLQEEAYIRTFVGKLLAESGPAAKQ